MYYVILCPSNTMLTYMVGCAGVKTTGATHLLLQLAGLKVLCLHLVFSEQAQTLFYKFGCDSQALLPYNVFAIRLLSCPARMLALEPEMAGPWRPGVLTLQLLH